MSLLLVIKPIINRSYNIQSYGVHITRVLQSLSHTNMETSANIPATYEMLSISAENHPNVADTSQVSWIDSGAYATNCPQLNLHERQDSNESEMSIEARLAWVEFRIDSVQIE